MTKYAKTVNKFVRIQYWRIMWLSPLRNPLWYFTYVFVSFCSGRFFLWTPVTKWIIYQSSFKWTIPKYCISDTIESRFRLNLPPICLNILIKHQYTSNVFSLKYMTNVSCSGVVCSTVLYFSMIFVKRRFYNHNIYVDFCYKYLNGMM